YRERRTAHDERPDEHAADRVGRRPVRRMILRQPALPDREQRRREVATIACDDFDAERLHLEMAVLDQRARETHRLINRPGVPMGVMDRTRQRTDVRGPDVVETEIAGAAKVAAGVEVAGRSRHPGESASGIAGRSRHAAAMRGLASTTIETAR